jgi:prophage regulatory protein
MQQTVSYGTIIRLPEVMKRTGLKRSSVYALMKKKNFPQSIDLGIRGVGWLEKEVDIWVTQRIEASRSI